MARIRTIKPEFWGDEKLAALPAQTRLVYIGLWSLADDAGRLVDNIKTIDGFIFPETSETSVEAIETLARLERIIRYQSKSGQNLIQIKEWAKHQRIDNPAKYVLPAPILTNPIETLDSSSRESSETLALNLLPTTYLPTTNDLLPPTYDRGPSTNGKTTDRQGFIKGFDGRKIRNTGSVLAWFAVEAKPLGLNPNDFLTRQRVIACAERAIDVGKKPGGLFLALVREGAAGDWSKLTDDQLDRGKRRLREFEGPQNTIEAKPVSARSGEPSQMTSEMELLRQKVEQKKTEHKASVVK